MKINTIPRLILSVFIVVTFNALSFGLMKGGNHSNFIKEKFEYKLEKGKEYKYLLETNTKVTQTAMGQETVINTNITSIYIFKVIDILSDGNYLLHMIIDSLKRESDNTMGPDLTDELSNIKGKPFKIIMTKSGEIKESVFLDTASLSETGKILTGQFNPKRSEFFPKYDDRLSDVGDSCTLEPKVDTVNMQGIKTEIKNLRTLKITGKEKVEGLEAYNILATSDGTLSGSGTQQGANIEMSGTVKSTANYQISKTAGLILGYKSESVMDLTAEVVGMGMTIPVNVVNNSTGKLIR